MYYVVRRECNNYRQYISNPCEYDTVWLGREEAMRFPTAQIAMAAMLARENQGDDGMEVIMMATVSDPLTVAIELLSADVRLRLARIEGKLSAPAAQRVILFDWQAVAEGMATHLRDLLREINQQLEPVESHKSVLVELDRVLIERVQAAFDDYERSACLPPCEPKAKWIASREKNNTLYWLTNTGDSWWWDSDLSMAHEFSSFKKAVETSTKWNNDSSAVTVSIKENEGE